MNDHLVGERRLARRCSLPGALILYSIAALALLAEAVHCAMLPAAELPGLWGDPLFEALLVLSQMTAIAAILLLGEFLRHFGADASPFGAGQSARLLAAAGLLVGRVLLEAAIKPAWPDDFRRIIDITYRFSAGWRRVHNPATGDDVADNLTTTEFAACMLAARGWSNAEIAAHMGISVNRVKECISKSLKKLGVSSRKELGRFLLS